MRALEDYAHITGLNEHECFILLQLQAFGVDFSLTEEGAVRDEVCMAYTAPAEDEVEHDGTAD